MCDADRPLQTGVGVSVPQQNNPLRGSLAYSRLYLGSCLVVGTDGLPALTD